MFNIELSSIDRCGHFVRLAADELGEVLRHDEDAPKPVPAAGAGVPLWIRIEPTGAPDPSTGAPVPPAAVPALSCCLFS